MLAAACWGSGTVLSRVAVDDVAPLVLLPLQLATSLAFLILAMRRRGEPVAFLTRPRALGALGILNPGLAYALGLLGLAQLSASVAVVIWATEPALVALLALPIHGERLRPSVVALSAVAIGGIVILAGDPAAGGTAVGIAFVAAAVLGCAIYTVATRRWLPDAPATLGVVVAQQAAALAFALVVVGLAAVLAPGFLAAPGTGTGVGSAAPTATLVGSVVASGLVYYGLAYWLYLDGLRRVPASLAATAFYLIPVFGSRRPMPSVSGSSRGPGPGRRSCSSPSRPSVGSHDPAARTTA
ncbi:MAG: DMT family transporter [Chloroflexi bacterium]|nr:DMT family transporter [Chloroflexota bacterium]